MQQMMDAHQWLLDRGLRSSIPQRVTQRQGDADDDMTVGSEGWEAWFMSRDQGVVFSESIRSYGPATEPVLQNLQRARAIRAFRYEEYAQRRMGDLFPYSRGEQAPSDLDMLLSVASSERNLSRTIKTTAVVLLQCKACKKFGLIQ